MNFKIGDRVTWTGWRGTETVRLFGVVTGIGTRIAYVGADGEDGDWTIDLEYLRHEAAYRCGELA